MIEFFIAKKQILERKKQSFVSIIGVLIGITVLIVSIGVSNGLDKNMINSILSLTSHITVPIPNIENYRILEQNIEEKVKEVKGVISTVESQGILKFNSVYGSYASGVKVLGYDLEKAVSVMNIDEKIVDGKIDAKNKKSILIGKELADIANIEVGNTINLITSENTDIELEVSGIFQSGFYEYDANMVILPLITAQYINYLGDTVTKLSIIVDDPYKAQEIKPDIEKVTETFVYTWGEQSRALLSALTLEKTIMIVVFSLIVVIAGFLIWITLNTLVREKTKDIGILRSMGFSKKNILLIFLIQGLTLGGIGVFIGVILSLVLLWYIKTYTLAFITNIYYIKSIPIEISVKEIFIVVFSNFIIILISSILPAYRASKMENVEALRHE